MSVGLYSHTTRGTGTVLTAAIYNSDHVNHITNANPSMHGGYSDNVSQMQALTDPGGVGSESLAATIAGELERIRFAIKRIVGQAHWYVAPANDLSDIGSPTDFLFSETLRATGDLTPAQITSNQNDYAPTGHADAFTFRLSSDAARSVTGLAGGVAGRIIELANVGANIISLTHEDAASAAANRFVFNSGQAPLSLSAGEAMLFKYDGTLSRWRPMGTADMDKPSFGALTVSGASTLTGAVTQGSYQDNPEIAAPGNPAANSLRYFVKDDTGKTLPSWLDSAGVDPTIPSRGYSEYADNANLASIPLDDTIPAITEGTETNSVTFTLKRPNSRVKVSFKAFVGGTASVVVNAALFVNGATDAVQASAGGISGNDRPYQLTLQWEHAPGSVGPHTYAIRCGPHTGGTGRLNGFHNARLFGGAAKATLIVEEIFI